MCLCVHLLLFVQLGIYWTSWLCRSIFFLSNLGSFYPLFLQIILIFFFPFSYLCRTLTTHILIYLMLYHMSPRVCSFFNLVSLLYWIISIVLLWRLLNLFSAISDLLFNSLGKIFIFIITIFTTPTFQNATPEIL